jgi:hypothetical protein
MAFKKGQKRHPKAGKKKGSRNRKTIERDQEFKEFSDGLFGDKEYNDSVKRRLVRGKAPHLERYIWEKRYGKEPLKIESSENLIIKLVWGDSAV